METKAKVNDLPVKVLVNFCRIILGAVFMFSGIVKAIDPVGTQIKLSDYLYAFEMGGSVLDSTLLIVACILAGFEILIGAYLVIGAFCKGTSLIVLVLMFLLTGFTLFLAITNPVEDCGCFGDAIVLTNWQTFYKNVFLFLLSIYVFWRRSSIIPFVSAKRQWLVFLILIIVILKFISSNIRELPVLDFRPYKVGTDLCSGVLEDKNPELSDFCIFDQDMNDVTSDILSYQGYTFLVVAPHLESAIENNLDLLDDMYDYCQHYGYRIIGLTSSGTQVIRKWSEETGTQYEFLHCDDVPLQTMVRSNPGLVLLKDGIIINKWSHANIPSDEELTASLDNIWVGSLPSKSPMRTPWAVALVFLVPLLLIVLIDKFRGMIQ